MVDSFAGVTQENTDVKLVIIKQKTTKPYGKLVRRLPHLEDVYPIPFEVGDPSGIYLIPKTADVECTPLDIDDAVEKMKVLIAAFAKTRQRMPASVFEDISEDMRDDLRVLETFGMEEAGGQEEKEERACG